MYRIKNTADDRSKHLKHRMAAKFELEPNLGGHRIRTGTHYDISDEHYGRVKPVIDEWEKKGMVDVFPILPDGTDVRKFATEPEFNGDGLQLGGPTVEEWVVAGYNADNYPPQGYASVFSPGFVALQRAREETAAQKAAEGIKEALILSTVTEQILPAIPMEELPVVPPIPMEPPIVEPILPPVPVLATPPPPPTNKVDKNKKFR